MKRALENKGQNVEIEYQSIDDEIDILVIIASFILDFILISPFPENNIKMAKLLTLLLLNKNGYEVGRYMDLGKIYDERSQV